MGLMEAKVFKIKQILLSSLKIITLLWVLLTAVTKIVFLNEAKVSEVYKNSYSVYNLYNILAIGSIEGSGEYAYISFYSKDYEKEVKSCYLDNNDLSFFKLRSLSLNPEDEEIISDGNYFIGDIDFDKSYEVIKFSEYYYKIAKDIYEISPDSGVKKETSLLALTIIYLFCFFNNFVSYVILFVLIIINLPLLLSSKTKNVV